MKSLKTLRLTLPMMFAALMLTVAGAMSTASATTTRWVYQNAFEGNCLTYSGTTSNVWSGPCDGATVAWYWGASWTDNTSGVTLRQLKAWYVTGDLCLTTDWKTDTNAVWTSPCNTGNDGQYWSADSNMITNVPWLSASHLRTSANGDAVYSTTYAQPGIESSRWTWYGTHN
ncbi:hypothetical protein QF037_000070 [Streptomyces canus]|uniref:hypothetical protein n=1 Tax=Streptomyces canus TaxID=58343 RepID=UPI002782ACC6|nr:hypothetical protein [Streptomyces canus]MDQ0595725.1 hypothetical protein [Streptomyces canus]